MKTLRLFAEWLAAVYVHYFVETDTREKCPCCGRRQLHPMRYDTESKRLLHMCKTLHAGEKQTFGCGAVWGTDTLVPAERWEATVKSTDEQGRPTLTQPEAKFHSTVSREPTIIRSNEQKEKAS